MSIGAAILAVLAIVLIFGLWAAIGSGRVSAGMTSVVFALLGFGGIMGVIGIIDYLASSRVTSPYEMLPPSFAPLLPPSMRPLPMRARTKRHGKAPLPKQKRLQAEASEAGPAAPPAAFEAPDAPPIVLESRESSPEPSKDPPRPAWMDAETGRVDNLYRTRIAVGPWLSRIECEQELPEALRRAVQTYADRLLGEGKGQSVDLPMSYIHEHIVRGEWEERRQQTIDTMIYLHELLEFDRPTNRMIEASYQQSVVVGRLGYIAAGGGALLGLLTILFGYLKLDTLTRGYYTGRLRLTAATAILGLAALAGLLAMG